MSSRLRVPRTEPAAPLPPFAGRGVGLIAAGLALLLLAFSGRYGYHRDELYFIACGKHLAWGYPDQPVLTPLLARLMTDISSSSLVVLRLPSDVAAGVTILMTGLTARELGFQRQVQVLASAAMSLTSLVLATGHLLSTSTFDLTAWSVAIWLGLRALRTGDERWWLAVGTCVAIGLQDSDLIFFLAVSLLAGLLVTGHHRLLLSPWLLGGAALAVAIWAPYLIWQGQHGWPELAIARNIANGGSGTSAPRAAFIPEQFLLAGPWLSPFLVFGLVGLCRRSDLRWARPFVVTFFLLIVIFIVTGGKPYYLGGTFPLLFAAGADTMWAWCRRANTRRRSRNLALLGVFSLPGVLITLPVLPLSVLHRTPIVAINYDAGETVGWPSYVRQISEAYRELPGDQKAAAVVLSSNYGEGGAVDRYGPALGLPAGYAVQNAFWLWGPPPSTSRAAVAVGFSRTQLTPFFTHVTFASDLNNGHSVNDDEQGEPIYLCSGLRRPWTRIWPQLRDYG